jgi:hypothetical protein
MRSGGIWRALCLPIEALMSVIAFVILIALGGLAQSE